MENLITKFFSMDVLAYIRVNEYGIHEKQRKYSKICFAKIDCKQKIKIAPAQ